MFRTLPQVHSHRFMTHRGSPSSKGGETKKVPSYSSYAEEVGKAFTIVPNSGVKSYDLQAFITYELPSVESLVRYFYDDDGFPVKSNVWMT